MFPFGKNDVIDFGAQSSSTNNSQFDDFTIDHGFLDEYRNDSFHENVFSFTSSEGQRQSTQSWVQEKNINEVNDTKKIMHKQNERQRRQVMTNLCSSLRSLLPDEYTKGKRSTSDHLMEAVKYVKDRKEDVQKLQLRRDELKNKSATKINVSTSNQHIESSGAKDDDNLSDNNCIVFNHCCDGSMEILINCTSHKELEDEKGYFHLSRVLEEIVEKGFDVISCCSSTTANGSSTTLHRIQIQVNNVTATDLHALQQSLSFIINC